MIRGRGFERRVIIRIDSHQLQSEQFIGPIDDLQVDGLDAAPGEMNAEQAGCFGGVENGDGDLGVRVFLRLGARLERAERWVRRVRRRKQTPQTGSQCEYHAAILATRRRGVQT